MIDREDTFNLEATFVDQCIYTAPQVLYSKIGWCDTVELYSSNNVNFTLKQTRICIKHWLTAQPFVKSYINLQTTAINAMLNVTAIQRSISVAEWQGTVNLEMKD